MTGSLRIGGRIIANDLRVYFRGWQRKSGSLVLLVFGQIFLQVIAHIYLPTVFIHLRAAGATHGGAEAAALVVLVTVSVAAMHRTIEVIYNRGDLPFLLASPVPQRIVLLTRLFDVVAGSALTSLVVVVPLLNSAVAMHGLRWLWGWPVWVAGVVFAASLVLSLSVILVRMIGARRARVAVQILTLVIGMGTMVVSQMPSLLRYYGNGSLDVVGYLAVLRVPPLEQVAMAAGGDAQWLIILGLAGVASLALPYWLLARQFAGAAQGAAAETASAAGDAARHRTMVRRGWLGAFRAGPTRVMTRTELRLILRDPLRLSRCAAQFISLVPALVGVLIFKRAAGVAVFAIVAPAFLAAGLGGMMAAADDAFEFHASSPRTAWRKAWARTLAAAFVPALVGWAFAIATARMGLRDIALFCVAGGTWNALTMAWLAVVTTPRQSAEDRAANRNQQPRWQNWVAMLLGGLGASAVMSSLSGAPGIVVIILAVLAFAGTSLSLLARPRPAWTHA